MEASMEASVESRSAVGGTGKDAVLEQVERLAARSNTYLDGTLIKLKNVMVS